MYLLWHGTASIEMVSEKGRLLFDPFVPVRGSKVPVSIEDFDGLTDVFVTHGHLDHIMSIPEIVRRDPRVIVRCTETPYGTLIKKGVPKGNLVLIRYGDELMVNGFTVRVFHSKHAILPKIGSSRLAYMIRSPLRGNILMLVREHLKCRENDETVLCEVEAEGRTVCVMGSLNLRDDAEYPKNADLLVLPYNGWDDNYPPAVRAIERLKPKRTALDHYDDTFPPLTMPVDLEPILKRYGGNISAMELGKREEV